MWRILVLSVLFVSAAHADTRGVLRFGVMPLDLRASPDTPFFGDDIARAMQYGVDERQLDVHDTMLTVAPALEIGDAMFFRLEGIAGFGDDLRSFGVGVYPINVQLRLSRKLVAYASAGGTASYLDRHGDGVGGLASARLAAGARVKKHLVVEAGYGAFVLGGVVDRPNQVVAAGEGRGIVDLAVGVAF
jgi:hypothetical protein